MTYPSIEREKKILELLQQQGSASIQELVEVFGVSNMTIHRDLNKMVEAGHIQKKHGGVTLAGKPLIAGDGLCAMCGKLNSERAVFIINMANGGLKRTCCAHCGLMIQSQTKNVLQSLTTDYLHGHKISANQAFYLLGSDLNICCVPSILSFGSQKEAEKFRKGFGGSIANMDETLAYLHIHK